MQLFSAGRTYDFMSKRRLFAVISLLVQMLFQECDGMFDAVHVLALNEGVDLGVIHRHRRQGQE